MTQLDDLLTQRVNVVFKRMATSKLKDGSTRIYFGEYDDGINTITIDLRKGANPARTFLHELIHKKYSGMSETEVTLLERKLWRNATQFQRREVYRILFLRDWINVNGK